MPIAAQSNLYKQSDNESLSTFGKKSHKIGIVNETVAVFTFTKKVVIIQIKFFGFVPANFQWNQ